MPLGWAIKGSQSSSQGTAWYLFGHFTVRSDHSSALEGPILLGHHVVLTYTKVLRIAHSPLLGNFVTSMADRRRLSWFPGFYRKIKTQSAVTMALLQPVGTAEDTVLTSCTVTIPGTQGRSRVLVGQSSSLTPLAALEVCLLNSIHLLYMSFPSIHNCSLFIQSLKPGSSSHPGSLHSESHTLKRISTFCPMDIGPSD